MATPATPSPSTINDWQDVPSPHTANDWQDVQDSRIIKQVPPSTKKYTKDDILNFLRPLVSAGVGTAAGAAATPFVSPAGGTAVGLGVNAGVNAAIRSLMDKQPTQGFASSAIGAEPGSTTSKVLDPLEEAGINEVGGRVLGRVVKGLTNIGREIKVPGSVVGDINKLEPTFSQYGKTSSGQKSLSGGIEDIFAPRAKAEALLNSATKGEQQVNELASKISGRPVDEVSNPQFMAQVAQAAATHNELASQATSNQQATLAKLIAKGNVEYLPNPRPQTGEAPLLPGSLTQPTNEVRRVEGPVRLDGTLQKAQDYLIEMQKTFGDISRDVTGVPTEDVPLVRAAQNLLRVTNTKISPAGAINGHDPVSFSDAWEFKQRLDKLYGKNPDAPSFSRALNSDIDSSLSKWPNDPNGAALQAWQRAKQGVQQRLAVFGDDGVKQLVNNTNSPIPIIDGIINDSNKLQRALTAGELKTPDGVIHSTNMRRDLAGYELKKLYTQNFKVDPINKQTGKFDAQGLTDALDNSDMKDSYDKLFGADRSKISELFINLAKTSGQQNAFGAYLSKMWIARAGLTLGPALFTGTMTHSVENAAGVMGLELSGIALARIMANPTAARMMIAASKGAADASDNNIGRAVMGAIQGSRAEVSLLDSKGRKTPGTIDKDGKFIPH